MVALIKSPSQLYLHCPQRSYQLQLGLPLDAPTIEASLPDCESGILTTTLSGTQAKVFRFKLLTILGGAEALLQISLSRWMIWEGCNRHNTVGWVILSANLWSPVPIPILNSITSTYTDTLAKKKYWCQWKWLWYFKSIRIIFVVRFPNWYAKEIDQSAGK